MNIFHIINSLGTGGSESILYSLIKNDLKSFHTIFLISEKGSTYKAFFKLKNCKILNLSSLNLLKKLFLLFKFVKNNKEIKKQLTFNSWMYKSHIYLFIIKIFINFQLIVHVRHCGITNQHSIKNKIPIFITLFFSKLFANRIIYNSFFSKKNHERIGFPKDKGLVIQNGFEKMNKENFKFKRIFNNKIVIGMLARQNFIKDHITLINVFAELSKKNKNLILFLQGSGLKNDRKIKNIIYKNKISNIIFSESLNKEYFYKQIDIHVLSSFGESFPNVVAESMIRKIITLSSEVGDVRYILPKKFIFKTGNENDLKRKLLPLINNLIRSPKSLDKSKDNLKKIIYKKFKFSTQLLKFKRIWKNHFKTKKILLVLPSLEGGGAERVMTFLSKDLIKKGYDTTILVLGFSKNTQYDVDKNIKLIFLNKKRSLFATYQIIKFFYKDFDLVISTIIQCNIICIFAKFFSFSRTKLYVRETNTPSEILKYEKNLKNFASVIIRKLYFLSDLILCNSKGVIFDLKNSLKISKKKLFFLPNSLDQSLFEKKSNEKIGKINKPYFLFAGRLSKQKNVQQIIKAFELFKKNDKKHYLYIFGQGQEKFNLLNLINDLNLKNSVFIKSFNKNIFKYIKNSEGSLLSSKWEGMPNILLQSLCLNKPVISTDCKSGPKELREFGFNVTLVPIDNHVKYANAIDRLARKKKYFSKNTILNQKYSDIYWERINKLF